MFFDSHAHFDRFVKDGTFDEILERAREAGVSEMVAVGGNAPANALSLRLAREHPGRIYGCAGYDRDEATKRRVPLAEPQNSEQEASKDEWEVVDLELLKQQVADPLCRAVGETGLDYYYTAETAADQKRLFAEHCALAAEFGKPVVVHSRDADEDTVAILRDYAESWKGAPDRPGVLHCFTRERPFARQVLDLGLMISFSGIVTFGNADPLREVASYVPDDRLLIETDSPYLTPVPMRGRRNEPAYVVHVAKQLAELKGTSLESMANLTAGNARRLFGL
jgi:TatD DNase family protein